MVSRNNAMNNASSPLRSKRYRSRGELLALASHYFINHSCQALSNELSAGNRGTISIDDNIANVKIAEKYRLAWKMAVKLIVIKDVGIENSSAYPHSYINASQ